MSVENESIPLSEEPRLIEFTLNPQLQDLLGRQQTQTVNLLVGGNVPESGSTIMDALNIAQNDRSSMLEGLRSVDDLPWHMYDEIVEYNKTAEKPLRFIDTTARIKLQHEAFKERIRKIVADHANGTESLVFTVCGASPPDLQAVKVIQELNTEFANSGESMPQLYVSMFLPGDEEAVRKYSVDEMGLHPEYWRGLYDQAKADNEHVFIHEPHAAEQFASEFTDPQNASFAEVRKLSIRQGFGHNRGALVDVNRTITEFAFNPPVLGMFAESFEVPKQLRGSGLELVARQLWLLTEYYGYTEEEAFNAVQIEQAGFIQTSPWTRVRAREMLRTWTDEFTAEHASGNWLGKFIAIKGSESIGKGEQQFTQIAHIVNSVLRDGYGFKVGLTTYADVMALQAIMQTIPTDLLSRRLRVLLPSEAQLKERFSSEELLEIRSLQERIRSVSPAVIRQLPLDDDYDKKLLTGTSGATLLTTKGESNGNTIFYRRAKEKLMSSHKGRVQTFRLQTAVVPNE